MVFIKLVAVPSALHATFTEQNKTITNAARQIHFLVNCIIKLVFNHGFQVMGISIIDFDPQALRYRGQKSQWILNIAVFVHRF